MFATHLFLVLVLPAALCVEGPVQVVSWSSFPQAVFINDFDDEEFYLGFWISKRWIVGPSWVTDDDTSTFEIQSGDVVNAPLTHPVVRQVYFSNSGRMALFKTCVKSKVLAVQSMAAADFWDFTSANTTGTILFVKWDTTELATRSTEVLTLVACRENLREGDPSADHDMDPHQVCTKWDPAVGACSHLLDDQNNYVSYPWLVINKRMEAWLHHDHCTSDGMAEGAQLFASVGYSRSLIVAAAGL